MATRDEMTALMAVACPWCSAAPGEPCSLPAPRRVPGATPHRPRRPSTLDGGTHDARWQAALGRSAPVLTSVVESFHVRRPVGARR